MVFARAFFLAALALGATATPSPRAYSVLESRRAPPSGFVQSAVAPPEKEITLRIQLKNNNLPGLEETLLTISDPASGTYGQWLTIEEVNAFVAPTAETVSAVSEWLAEHDIESKTVSPAGDELSITIPVSKANTLLATDFGVFEHIESGTKSIRTLEYSIPASLQSHIDLFFPTTSFTPPLTAPKFTAVQSKRSAENAARELVELNGRAVPASCNTVITPACLQAIYNIKTTAATQTSNKLAVSGFIEQWANSADLRQFLTDFRKDVSPATTFTLETLDGGVNTQTRSQAGIEANLDIQYTIGVATGVPVQFVSVGENNPDGVAGFIDIVNLFLGQAAGTRPNVFTTSYGFNEPDLTRAMAQAMCAKYTQLGALGTSILFSSGDGGVSGSQSQSCTNFVPTAPSGCPFVTSVGSTQGITETAASFSSGGFTNYFAIPSYQSAAVATYLAALGTTNSGRFNRTGRGFPDVSLQGVNFEIAWTGLEGTVSGTSCSSPSLAAMIALINDELVAAGKPVLGFLNPFFYSATGRAAINDITSGSNPGCNTNGFPSLPGWDAVTGLGTVDYLRLRAAVGL
ncbi:Peptidase S53 domain-containing protein [Mycena kentingensis (nom. inval.)]|nr:Peptidase S53 domain-containing protein [Mycena kentingensis (nom. inval.)]